MKIKKWYNEHLELDQVAGDFVDWYSERVHILCVRQSEIQYDTAVLSSKTILMHFKYDVNKLFDHSILFYKG